MSMTKPPIFTTPFASGGNYTPLSLTSSTTVINQVLGIPQVFATPYSSGGQPVPVNQTNGIWNAYSTQSVWQQGGGTFTYEPAFVTATGGYDAGTILFYAAANRYVISLIGGNNFNFLVTPGDIDGVHWQYLDTYSAAANFPNITDIANLVSVTGSGGLAVTHGITQNGYAVVDATTINNDTLAGNFTALQVGGDAVTHISQFGYSIGASGYQILPTGLIIQWGSVITTPTTNNPTFTLTFPLVFPNSCFSITGNGSTTIDGMNPPGIGIDIVVFFGISVSGCTGGLDSNSGTNFSGTHVIRWIAIGN